MKASKMMDGTPVLFRPEMHAHRMNLSAKRMCMPEFPEDWFVEGLKQLIDLDQAWIPPAEGSALYIRPTMIATDEFIGVRPSSRYLFFIITGPVGPYYPKPVRLITEPNYVRAVVGGTGEAKAAGNYGAAMLPSKLAQEKGFDQVLWLDPPAYKTIQECGTMNVFFVIGNKVITPPLNGTILKGITRDSFLQILRTESYDVEEYPLTVDELVDAYKKGQLKEAFGAGTAAVLSHVSEIEHNGFLMKLPDISERKVGHFLKATIDGMRFGRLPDKYGWIVPAHSLVTA
jgi:branched-chain amino acid aminotransferase